MITLMNATYYIIRLIMSGYTNIGAWELFTLTGIAGSMYIGTIITFIKACYHKQNSKFLKYNFIFMTVIGLLFSIYGWYNVSMSHNLFYNINLEIIIFPMKNRKYYICNARNETKLNNKIILA